MCMSPMAAGARLARAATITPASCTRSTALATIIVSPPSACGRTLRRRQPRHWRLCKASGISDQEPRTNEVLVFRPSPFVVRHPERTLMKLAFTTLACPGWSLEQAVAAARQYGYEGIELRLLDGELVRSDLDIDTR